MNLKPNFWDYSKEIMGFHLTHKKVLLPVKPWVMRMQWESTIIDLKKSWYYHSCLDSGSVGYLTNRFHVIFQALPNDECNANAALCCPGRISNFNLLENLNKSP